ncbi:MAG: DUF4838 domain-containing protein [Verrucomicrobiota bacterium]|nr:DUF4838 domain-containing protein [Verrucomicrobiota bacterium]
MTTGRSPGTPSITALVALASFCLSTLAFAAEQGLLLAENGQPKATIVIAAQADVKTKLAADELQAYLGKISNAKLPIVTDTNDVNGTALLVGRSKLTDALGVVVPSGLTNARREEGFVMLRRDDRIVLAGNNDGPYHGTEYAVYDFLRALGVRWFMPSDFGEMVPRAATLVVPEFPVANAKPDFVMRNWWLHIKPELKEQETRWKLRNKMNADPMFATPGDSSARKILPEKLYFKDHPELFAMKADKSRNPHMPNLSNPKTVEIAAGIIRDHLRKNPEANSYGFSPDDGLPRDFDPETVKRNAGFVAQGGREGVAAEASISEEWMRFVNAVAAEVHKEFPEVYIAANGYANRDMPPQGVTLDKRIVVMFAAIWSCTLHAYDDPHCWQKTRQGQMLRRWAEMSPNVWIYGFNYGMLVSGLTPIPETRKLRRDFPLMKKWGVMGFYDETRNAWAERGIASRWLRAQLEWNANADVDALLADFYPKWYGAAAGPMRAYYDALEEAIEETPIHGHEDRVMPEIYSGALLTNLARHLSAAEAAADNERAKTHVRADRLVYDHLAAYMALYAAECAGDFAAAARQCARMLELRGQLHSINPFYVWSDEKGLHTGIWYWGAEKRRQYYEKLAGMTSGPAGELVVLLPEKAAFRTDPHDDGLFAEWYQPAFNDQDWSAVSSTRPFYMQGHSDQAGRTYTGQMWYRFKVKVPGSAEGKKVMLYAPVIETEAWCWVNGQFIGHRPYLEAYVRPCAMELDITRALKPGSENVIAIRVSTSLAPAQAASGILSRLFLYAPKGGTPE